MENVDESGVGGNDLPPGCDNTSPIGMGPDYDLQQSNLALLKAELKVDRLILLMLNILLPPFLFSVSNS